MAVGLPFGFLPFLASALLTSSEKEGRVSLRFESVSEASTGRWAKMCSGSSSESSMPVSTMREAAPETRMPARRQETMMNSRLLPVLIAARAMTKTVRT